MRYAGKIRDRNSKSFLFLTQATQNKFSIGLLKLQAGRGEIRSSVLISLKELIGDPSYMVMRVLHNLEINLSNLA